ncbi:MAG: hypothetical protein JRC68_10395 [Deltaproteobacteria bacterium]|nr:hypothetical protein [Deltaproteobacteria bacterium]
MGKSYAQHILEAIEEEKATLLVDQFDRPHIHLPGKDLPISVHFSMNASGRHQEPKQ